MCGKRKQPFSKIVTHILGGFCVTAVSVLLAGTGIGSDVNTVIIGGIMPLITGSFLCECSVERTISRQLYCRKHKAPGYIFNYRRHCYGSRRSVFCMFLKEE